MANNIKYLDQKGLKTFHDATGWVTIEIPVNGKFVVYDESPIKFINGGLMDIGNMPNQGISAGDVKRFARGTLIVNKANSEIKLEIFTRHYNQLIQHEFKTDKLTLPGTTSQVVLGNGSLKGLDNLIVGGTKNAENIKIIEDVKEGLILSPITSTKIPLLGVYGSYDYNTPRKIDDVYLSILNGTPNEFHITTDLYVGSMDDSGFTRGNIYGNLNGDVNVSEYDQSALYLTGCNSSGILRKNFTQNTPNDPNSLNIYMYYSGENNLYSPNLHTRRLFIEKHPNDDEDRNLENEVLQGNGQPILKADLVVGSADISKKILVDPLSNGAKYDLIGIDQNHTSNPYSTYNTGAYVNVDLNGQSSITADGLIILNTVDDILFQDNSGDLINLEEYIESLTASDTDILTIFNQNSNNTNT